MQRDKYTHVIIHSYEFIFIFYSFIAIQLINHSYKIGFMCFICIIIYLNSGYIFIMDCDN